MKAVEVSKEKEKGDKEVRKGGGAKCNQGRKGEMEERGKDGLTDSGKTERGKSRRESGGGER